MTTRTIIILLGPPGSGKGSQAALIKTHMRLPHLSTGDLLRENVAAQSPLGKIAKSYIDHGQLVPDAIILDMIMHRIEHEDCKKGFLLDGFPRTLVQAEKLQLALSASDQLFIINLKVDDALIIERITGRLICSKCMTPYHLRFAPPKIPNVCDACGGELYQRADDTHEVIARRLAVYHQQTAPLIEFYQNYPYFSTIDGTRSKEDIFNDLVNALHIKS
jgi:adenylate kinase